MLMCMTDLEKIEDKYPQLKFYMIDVPNPHYHGHIMGNEVYLNRNQPELDWLKTALHETIHYDFDYGDLSNTRCCHTTLMAEGFARKQSEKALADLIKEKRSLNDA